MRRNTAPKESIVLSL